MSNTQHKTVTIIGSGPAGLTAAIYTARAGLAPLVIHGILAGGQLTTTTEVENFPGFPEGIMGPELMELLEKQAKRFGAETMHGQVLSVDFSKKPYTLNCESVSSPATLKNGNGNGQSGKPARLFPHSETVTKRKRVFPLVART